MRDSLHMRQPMRIVGTPGQTILLKASAVSTTLAEPMPMTAVTLKVADISGLRWKDGIHFSAAGQQTLGSAFADKIAAVMAQKN